MKRRSPYATLLAVMLLGLVLLGVNLASRPINDSSTQASAGPSASSSSALPPAPPAPPVALSAPSPVAAPAPVVNTQPFPTEAKYTGRTDDNSASIAVTVHDGRVSAYLCDGKVTEGWYQGSAADGTIDAKGKGANALNGSLSGSTLSGTVSAHGRSWNYSATPAPAPAGLYRAKKGNRTAGWIKDRNGRVTGLAHRGTTVEPAGPLDPRTAQPVQGGDQVVE